MTVVCEQQGLTDNAVAAIHDAYRASPIRWRTTLTLAEGVVSIHDRRGRHVMCLGVQDGTYHALDHEGEVITEGPSVDRATRAFNLI